MTRKYLLMVTKSIVTEWLVLIMTHFLCLLSFLHVRLPADHRSSNGQAERSVAVVRNGLRKASASAKQRLGHALLKYRYSVTWIAPAVSLKRTIYVTEK